MAKESKGFQAFRYIFLVLSSVFVLIPIVPLIYMAFKTGAEYTETSVLTPPKNWFNMYNFAYAIRVGNLGKALITTVVVLAISLTLQILFTTMAAYVLHRFEFKMKKIVTSLFTLTMFIPLVTTQTVVFQIMYKLKLVSTIWSVIILYSGVGCVGLYIMFNLLDSISKELI